MKLSTKWLNLQTVLVTTDWTTYTVFFSREAKAIVIATGLEQEFSLDDFPSDAKNEAIAAYLIVQLELKSIE